MKDFNFDKLKNIKTPESWIENAVNIPNVQKKPKKVIPFNTRVVATAACVALCFVLGSVMLPIVNTDPTTVVRPLSEPTTENPNNDTQNISETKGYNYSSDSTDPTLPTILPVILLPNGETVPLYPTNNTDSFNSKAEIDEINKGNGGQHTGNASVSNDETTVTFATEPEETVSVPQEIPTEPIVTEPVVTEPTEQTTMATIPTYTQPVTVPTIRPTYTHPVTIPTEPNETESDYAQSTEQTTEVVEPTEPVTRPPHSTQPTVAPTEPTISTVPTTENKLFKNSVIFYPANISDYTNDGNIYCHIVGTDGKEYAQKFSSAEVSNLKSGYIVYNPYNSLGNLTMEKNKYYDIYFYTKSHTSKTYRCYLGANNYYIIE